MSDADLSTDKFKQATEAVVVVPTGFTGLVVVWEIATPQPTPPYAGTGPGPWFKRQLFVHGSGAKLTFTPGSDFAFVVNFKAPFEPNNENILTFATTYWNSVTHPLNGGSPVVT